MPDIISAITSEKDPSLVLADILNLLSKMRNMKSKIKPKAVAPIVAIFLMSVSFAQSNYEGDALRSYLGKPAESAEVKGLVSNYHCDIANPGHCFSMEGLEVMLQKGIVTEIRLHQNSAVYGSFKGKLPRGLRFGMSSDAIRAILGKPTVNYQTSGYSEFDLHDYSIACWLEGGKLTQITISTKP